jgi:hypothetical protein
MTVNARRFRKIRVPAKQRHSRSGKIGEVTLDCSIVVQ